MLRAVASVAAAALAGAASLANPLDSIARGKLVRHFQTRKAEMAATVCLPATTAAERGQQVAALPGLLADLERAGARSVALDFDVGELPEGITAATTLPLAVGMSDDEPASAGWAQAGHRGATQAGPAAVVLSLPVERGGRASLAGAALGLHRGEVVSASGETLTVGDQTWSAHSGEHTFMPYEIPFLDWDDRPRWSGVAGRTVFVGACRLDRHLTRFGRQPAVVAHGELFETLRDGREPREVSRTADAALGAVAALAALATRRWSPRAGPALVGVVGVALVAAAQLHGLWIGLGGVVLGALLPLLAQRRAAG